MIEHILWLLAGFVLLVLGGNWLLKASVDLASRLGLSKIIIGLTVVSLATSAPELIVSINAAIQGSSGIAMGNVIGSNIANIGLVLGITVLITPIKVPTVFLKTDWVFLIFVNLLLIGFIWFDHTLSSLEGICLLALLMLYIFLLIRRKEEVDINAEAIEDITENQKWHIILFFLLIGGVGLWLGADLLVKNAIYMAEYWHIPQSVIGVTVIAVGTSVPELAASIVAVVKKEKSISFGNLIGSNIFNILSVLGITAIIRPIQITDHRFLTNDIWWMLGFALILFPFIWMLKKNIIDKIEGALLVILYIVFIYLAF